MGSFLLSLGCFFASVQTTIALLDKDGNVAIPGASSYNGLNPTPQMGFNTWNAYGCKVDEALLLDTAAALVKYGLRDLGYNYVIVDDCWSEGRNDTGYLVANTKAFPNGMKSIVDKVHSLGLKFGIYSSAGIYTCAKYPGSLEYETKDAALWASWGVDYLKYDNCFNQGQSGTPKLSFDRYKVMSDALIATGRPILYSLCNWGIDRPYDWAWTIANSWRMSGDIYDSFSRPDNRCSCKDAVECSAWPGFHCSVLNILNRMASISHRTMPGGFNDMDMLEVGNKGQTDSEYVAHFSMWAINSSPLLIGTNVVSISPANLAILSNPAVIALNQDPSGKAAVRKWHHQVQDKDEYGVGEISLWTREMANGDSVIALLNAGNSSRTMTATAKDIFMDQATEGTWRTPPHMENTWDVYDLWANRMSEEEAAAVLHTTAANATIGINVGNSTSRYNSSEMSYAEGLQNRVPALFGQRVGTMQASGQWSVEVDRHSVALFRLQPVNVKKRDEL